MNCQLVKCFIVTTFFIVFDNINCLSQNPNISNYLSQAQWNSLFPRRAGTYGSHPQGYTTDFFSYANMIQAANEMADYLVEIRLKQYVLGQLITITVKSTNASYIYSNVNLEWHSNSTQETIINVDFADFVSRSSDLNNKRELAAFLANISKETTGGWQLPVGSGTNGDYAQWGLYWVHEVGYTSSGSAGAYSTPHPDYPPNPSVGYYGRGPIQLSWNYNYGQFSKFLYNDESILLNNPDLIQQDGVLSFKSAIWFWMMPQCPKPSCHQVMHELWSSMPGEYSANKMNKKGFAHTNNIINGGLECRTSSTSGFTEKVQLRSQLYKYYLNILGVDNNRILAEDLNDYTTLCYESSTNAMQDYSSCFLNSVPLSIVLIDFKATISGNSTLLSWSTSYENNFEYFTILKSKDGVSWKDLHSIEGRNDMQNIIDYTFWDHDAYSGVSYYRLKYTDYDGKFGLSNVFSIFHPLNEALSENFSIKIVPNPTNGTAYLSTDKVGEYLLELFDVHGNTIFKGQNVDQIDTLKFNNGLYYISMRFTDGQIKTLKIFIFN